MSATESSIRIGDKTQSLDSVLVTNSRSEQVHREMVVLADPENLNSRAHITQEGHLEVAVHSPVMPFGAVNVENLTPVFQVDGVYGINSSLVTTTTGLAAGVGANSASVTAADNHITASTGTTMLSFGTFQSRRRLRYRPGRGVVGRFAGHFSTPAGASIVVAGFGTAEAGFYFGYSGTTFGILHSTGSLREIHTLTITTASTATNNYQVTLPNTDVVTVTGATNNGQTARTAWEIAQGTFPGWSAQAQGSTVVFVAASVGNKSGSFSLAQSGAGTPAAGTDAVTVAGTTVADTFIPQAQWNGDTLDGSGDANNPSGFALDPSKGNVYQIGAEYLGHGVVDFFVKVTYAGKNNPEFVRVHTILHPNTTTSSIVSQPSFPFTAAAYSAGSTTNVSVSISAFAGFIAGGQVHIGPRSSYYNNSGVSSSTSAYTPIFTFANGVTFGGRPNQTVGYLLDVSGAAKSTNGLTTFYLIRNATLTGTGINFTQFYTNSSTYWDTGSTGCSFSSNSQVVWSGAVSESGNFSRPFSDREIAVQPGETITLAVRSVTATATCVGSLNVREDQ